VAELSFKKTVAGIIEADLVMLLVCWNILSCYQMQNCGLNLLQNSFGLLNAILEIAFSCFNAIKFVIGGMGFVFTGLPFVLFLPFW